MSDKDTPQDKDVTRAQDPVNAKDEDGDQGSERPKDATSPQSTDAEPQKPGDDAKEAPKAASDGDAVPEAKDGAPTPSDPESEATPAPEPEPEPEVEDDDYRAGWSALVALGLIVLISFVSGGPPSPADYDEAPEAFSAARAGDVLETLLGPKKRAHPVGSPANRAVKDRLVEALRGLEMEVDVQSEYTCSSYGLCTPVENVVARFESEPLDKPGVVLSAHYDSVPAGPGAGDDGAAVAAIVEMVRALKTDPERVNPIKVFISDGEEMGLLGAYFYDKHHWSHPEDVVLNMEARGSSGPSYLFETGPRNAWMIGHARAMPHPLTSSLYDTIYKILPNDTDFTVHRTNQHDGANFGFIENLSHYHTRLDNLENLDRGSLQHHGDNVLALARSLLQADLQDRADGQAIYFDVWSVALLSYPAGLALPLALLTLALLLAGVWMRRKRIGTIRLVVGAVAAPLSVVVAVVFGTIFESAIGAASGHPAPWWSVSWPFVAIYWTLGVAGPVALVALVGKGGRFWGFWAGIWGWWALAALISALFLPGISHMFVLPALAAAITQLVLIRQRRSWSGEGKVWACAVPMAVAVILWMPLTLGLPDAVGLFSSMVVVIPVALMASPMAPMLTPVTLTRRRIWPLAGTLTVATILTFVALLTPRATTWSPAGLNIVTVYAATDEDTVRHAVFQRPLTLTGLRPELPRKVAPLLEPEAPQNPIPWPATPEGTAVTDASPHRSPVFKELDPSQEGLTRLKVRSRRGAYTLMVIAPPGHTAVKAETHDMPAPYDVGVPFRRGNMVGHFFFGVPRDGLILHFKPESLSKIRIFDVSWGSAADAAKLRQARGKIAIPYQNGDALLVEVRPGE